MWVSFFPQAVAVCGVDVVAQKEVEEVSELNGNAY